MNENLRARRCLGFIAAITLSIAITAPFSAHAQTSSVNVVTILSDEAGDKLQVDGKDFMILGMNWGYMPIGQNYTYDFWGQPDDFIQEVLEREMGMLTAMGCNTIRQYVGIPPRWIQYIYEKYGVYTVLNHPMARYGYTLDGVWLPNTDYSNPRLREAVTAEIVALVKEFKDTPGLLMWLLGNENNYGLSWSSFEIEALPEGERNTARARYLYSLYGAITDEIKKLDKNHPVSIANGDLQYIDLIAEECTSLDILGTNQYRGISVRDMYDEVKAKLDIPLYYTEFGADAFNAKHMREDQLTQCKYLIGQWQEIYEQSYGKGRVGNAIGGMVFQWSDGWWKFMQDTNLDIHDTNASWPNAAYPEDYVEGDNNMNEEWWGITAKGRPDHLGHYELYPRAAYFALTDAWKLDPYAPTTNVLTIQRHFTAIEPAASATRAQGNTAALQGGSSSRVRVSGVRLEFETYNTGGARISTPSGTPSSDGFPSFRGFDQMESFFAEVEASPSDAVTGKVTLNVLGNVPGNPIDEIFYENRGRAQVANPQTGEIETGVSDRVKVYRASIAWDDRWFTLNGFYREGHFHWGYEGDFFGLYRESFYGENLDIYNGEGSVGLEIVGKKKFSGLKFAVGPELWWGANPAFMTKYNRQIGRFNTTLVYQEDIATTESLTSTFAIPVPRNRAGTLHLQTTKGPLTVEVGGIWSGNNKVGDVINLEDPDRNTFVQDVVKDSDTFGAKAKITFQKGRWNWYAQGARQGIVANGGPTAITTFTGWTLKDSGSGNQTTFLTGLAVNSGNFQFAPNFLWQKPLEGPLNQDVTDPDVPLAARNVLDDAFAVRGNRETVGTEILLAYDPTPATWMWNWDSIVREDARLAGSISFVHRHQPTTLDGSIGILANGQPFGFAAGTPARDLWEVRARVISKLGPRSRLVAHFYTGITEPRGDDPREIRRHGADARLVLGPAAFEAFVKIDDFGPYDYHQDFNLTYPLQLMGDVSYALGSQKWFGFPQTRFGVRTTYRTLDSNSPRYCPDSIADGTGNLVCDPTAPGENGREWEIRTYLHFAL